MARKLITYIPAPLAPTGIQTRCCYRMTYGNRRTSQRGSKQRSYTAGNPRHRNCDCQATRYIDGQPFCSMHAPEPKIKRINGRWHEMVNGRWIKQEIKPIEELLGVSVE